MPRTWATFPLLAALMVTVGCYTTERVRIRPPKRDEVYALPPVADARFEEPLKYPKGILNQDVVKSGRDEAAAMKAGGAGGPSMPRMGASGGGAPGGF